jgi:hypothetical protein
MTAANLPEELVELLALHSSFLTALALHYAHSGTATPIDVRQLTSSITSIWQKRQVTLDDIQLCLGVLSTGSAASTNPFYLSDYTSGKICLEVNNEHRGNGISGMLNEDLLQSLFVDSLDHLWREWNASKSGHSIINGRPITTSKRRFGYRGSYPTQTTIETFIHDGPILKFLSQLPKAEIKLCSSAVAVASQREKGRKRLRELQDCTQQGHLQKKARQVPGKENESVSTISQTTQPKITDFASVRKSNLLDRILAKQEAAASVPTPPPAAERQRYAALERSEEVLSVLCLLAASKGPGPRVSFSMAALLQSVQRSIRTPLSKDEVLRCVEVLASEVAPGYVTLVHMGVISSVVLNQSMRPVDIKSRLTSLGVA